MTVATIKSGDVHIPEDLLRKYGLSDGAQVAIEASKDGIVIHATRKMRSLRTIRSPTATGAIAIVAVVPAGVVSFEIGNPVWRV